MADHNDDFFTTANPIDRHDFESRLDALEISRAMVDLHIKSLYGEMTAGKEKFRDITTMLQEHKIAIELLKTMKEDISAIKTCVQNLKATEQERRGAWKVIAGISAAVALIIQIAASYIAGR